MKRLFLFANWKANKTTEEARAWLSEMKDWFKNNPSYGDKEIVVFPPYTALSFVSSKVYENEIPMGVGAQDVSLFGRGSFTGEIPVSLVDEFARYCLVGHSERRKNFHETDEIISAKVKVAKIALLQPVLCVQDAKTPIPQGVIFVAYEPVFAIGSGSPDTPENAASVAATIKQDNPAVQFVLYGGSVTSENVHAFTSREHIDGVLVGKASLEAKEFAQIIQNA